MTKRDQGFTLIEMMIVVALLAIIAAISVPNLLSARMNSNEGAAIATLKNIASAQAQFQATTSVDANYNGAGEFGYFGELSGSVGIRDASGAPSSIVLSPSILSRNFGLVESPPSITGGAVVRSGYVFQIFLPSTTMVGIPEADNGGVNSTAPDANRCEVLWCCYAWPMSFGNSGHRAFFINQTGEILATRNLTQRYSLVRPPTFDAAYRLGSGNGMGSTIAASTSGNDGQLWKIQN